ncbi:MAG: hypothetical protein R3E87_00730 [Burkholderiaceae bacterium]
MTSNLVPATVAVALALGGGPVHAGSGPDELPLVAVIDRAEVLGDEPVPPGLLAGTRLDGSVRFAPDVSKRAADGLSGGSLYGRSVARVEFGAPLNIAFDGGLMAISPDRASIAASPLFCGILSSNAGSNACRAEGAVAGGPDRSGAAIVYRPASYWLGVEVATDAVADLSATEAVERFRSAIARHGGRVILGLANEKAMRDDGFERTRGPEPGWLKLILSVAPAR